MIDLGRTRVVGALIAALIIGGSLAGCGQVTAGAVHAPVSVVTDAPTASTPSGASTDSSLSSIQDDLNSANSATTNAGGDVTDADNSAATNDSP